MSVLLVGLTATVSYDNPLTYRPVIPLKSTDFFTTMNMALTVYWSTIFTRSARIRLYTAEVWVLTIDIVTVTKYL
jgi:hypothetical protein